MLYLDNREREIFAQFVRNSLTNLQERLNMIPPEDRAFVENEAENDLRDELNNLETNLNDVNNALISDSPEHELQSLQNIRMMADLVHSLIGMRYQVEEQINDNFISNFEYNAFYFILSRIEEYFEIYDTNNPHKDDFNIIHDEFLELNDIAEGIDEGIYNKLAFNDKIEEIMWEFLEFLDARAQDEEAGPNQAVSPAPPEMPAQGGKRTKSRRKRTMKRKKGKKSKKHKNMKRKGKKSTKRRK